MQALIYLPHCVASILAYYSTTKDDYINVVMRVLRPPAEGRIREIYELYSYEFRKWYALVPHYISPSNLLSLVKDDIKEIFLATRHDSLIFAIENIHRITSLRVISGSWRDTSVYSCPSRNAAFIAPTFNINMFKNVKHLTILESDNHIKPQFVSLDSVDDVNLASMKTLEECKKVTLRSRDHISHIPKSVTHLTLGTPYMYWKGMTKYSRCCSGPFTDGTRVLKISNDKFISSTKYNKNILEARVTIEGLVVEITRVRADGTFIPTCSKDDDGNTHLDFSNIESTSITSLSIFKQERHGKSRATLPASLSTSLQKLHIILVDDVEFGCQEWPNLEELHINDPNIYCRIRGARLKDLSITSDRYYNDQLIIDEPALLRLCIRNINTKKLHIINHSCVVVSASYRRDYASAPKRIKKIFGDKYHYLSSGDGSRMVTMNVHMMHPVETLASSRYAEYFSRKGSEIVVNDEELYDKLRDHFGELAVDAEYSIIDENEVVRRLSDNEYLSEDE